MQATKSIFRTGEDVQVRVSGLSASETYVAYLNVVPATSLEARPEGMFPVNAKGIADLGRFQSGTYQAKIFFGADPTAVAQTLFVVAP